MPAAEQVSNETVQEISEVALALQGLVGNYKQIVTASRTIADNTIGRSSDAIGYAEEFKGKIG
jgi:hypothetical protein